jgi:dTDP-4-dehydrorhamnose reductase
VFDGRVGDYDEDDRPSPINIYGKSKLSGEKAALADCPGALVIRTNLFGWSLLPRRRGLAEWFLQNLEQGRACNGFTDVLFSPIHVSHLGEALLGLVGSGTQGILHLGGTTCLSKYAFGGRLAERFGLDAGLIGKATVEDADLLAARPKRICLNSKKAEGQLQHGLPGVNDGIALLEEQRSNAAPGEHQQEPIARVES